MNSRWVTPMLTLCLIAVPLIVQALYIVDEREQAIVLMFGRPIRSVQEPGLYAKLPFLHELRKFDKRVLSADATPVEYLTLDKKRVVVDGVLRWKIVDPLKFFMSVRTEPGGLVRLNDIISGRMREEIAKHTFIDFVRGKRETIVETVSKDVQPIVKQQLGVEVIDVRIKRLDLPEEVQQSVFARMRAERQRIAKRYRAEGEERAKELRAEARKETEIILAKAYEQSQTLMGEGDAEATKIYAEAYEQDPEFYSLIRRLEAYEKSFKNDSLLVLSAESDLLKYLEDPVSVP